jgi:spore maturation protein CgeB
MMSEPLSHNDFFVPGKHFIEFRDANELVNKARYYLEHEDERNEIAQAGFDLVTKNLASHIAWPRLIDEVLANDF